MIPFSGGAQDDNDEQQEGEQLNQEGEGRAAGVYDENEEDGGYEARGTPACPRSRIVFDSLNSWHLCFLFTVQRGRRGSNRVSQLQFYAYYLHTCDNVFSTTQVVYSKSGWLMHMLRLKTTAFDSIK